MAMTIDPEKLKELLANNPEAIQQLQELAAQSSTVFQPTIQGITPTSVSMSEATLPQTDKETQKAIRQKFMESQQQQQQEIASQQQALAKELKKQEEMGFLGKLDLRPFAQAVAGYGATNVAMPTAPEDRAEIIAKLREQIQKGQRGLTQDQVGMLKALMEDRRSLQAGISERNAQARETERVTTQFYKLGTAAEDYKKDSNLVQGVINKEKIPVRELSMLVTKIGKSLGEVGNQTENDRLSYYKPTLEAQLSDILTRVGMDGTLNKNDPSIKAIRSIISEAQKEANAALGGKANLYKDMMSATGSPYSYLFKKGRAGDVGYQKVMSIANKPVLEGTEESETDKLKKELKALEGSK